MTVDYLSTLNSKGSGLNVTQLVDSIVNAEIEPAKALINDKSSANDLSISEIALLRSRMNSTQNVLEGAGDGGLFSVQSASTAIGVSVTDPQALTESITGIEVQQLASAQVLEFTGYSSKDATLSAGTLSIDTGTWDSGTFTATSGGSTQTVTLSATTTLAELATLLDALSGVSAQVLDKGDGTFSLSVSSALGAANALQITASGGAPTDFDTTDGSNQVSAAANAQIVMNGITVERASNTVSDLIAGVELNLNSVTTGAQNISVSKDEDTAKAELRALVDQINTLRGFLDTATARGINGAKAGPLAGDAGIAAIQRELAALTTAPLTGFGDTPVYLAEIGVRTELDGSLSVDEEKLSQTLDNRPELFQAVFRSSASMSASNLGISFGLSAEPPEGAYDFVYDSGDDTATLNGQTLSSRTNAEGQQEFYRLTGDFNSVTIKVLEGSAQSATAYVGVSLADKMNRYLTEVLGTKGDISTKETYFNEKLGEYTEALADLDTRAEVLEARELKRFTQMEQAVTQLKSTGEYITSMMDAWNKED